MDIHTFMVIMNVEIQNQLALLRLTLVYMQGVVRQRSLRKPSKGPGPGKLASMRLIVSVSHGDAKTWE